MIMTRATCVAQDGRRDNAIAALRELREQTMARGGAVFYGIFDVPDTGEIITTEIYASSDEVLVHNSTENFDSFLSAVAVRSIEVYGNPSQELVDAWAAWPVRYHPEL
jgi:quinol monooxygenase YgiN